MCLLDELIRQVTIESPERGLLLMRVRDEVRMTIAAYQTLYNSSITFGMRKTLQAEQGNAELIKKIEELETEKKKLHAAVQDHKGLYEAIEKVSSAINTHSSSLSHVFKRKTTIGHFSSQYLRPGVMLLSFSSPSFSFSFSFSFS